MSDPDAPRIIEISRQMDALALERTRLLVGFESRRGYERDGCVNAVAWLKTHCRLSTSAAMEAMSVARRLPELPEVDRAVEQGAIGFQHAAVVAESADKLGSDSLLEHQAELIRHAESSDPSALRQEVRNAEP